MTYNIVLLLSFRSLSAMPFYFLLCYALSCVELRWRNDVCLAPSVSTCSKTKLSGLSEGARPRSSYKRPRTHTGAWDSGRLCAVLWWCDLRYRAVFCPANLLMIICAVLWQMHVVCLVCLCLTFSHLAGPLCLCWRNRWGLWCCAWTKAPPLLHHHQKLILPLHHLLPPRRALFSESHVVITIYNIASISCHLLEYWT